MSLLNPTIDAVHLLLSGDVDLWRIIWVSLRTTFLSLLIASPVAVLAGYALAGSNFMGRRVLIWLVQTALSMPTVLVGLLLYLLLSRQGPMGGLGWLFSPTGIVLGQVLIVLPVLVAFSMTAVQAIDSGIAETAISLGAGRWRCMWTVMREARFGVIAALISGFGRVISEVGCAMMVGGNIEGSTRTMTTAIALQSSKGEFAQGIALGVILLLLALLMNAALMLVQGDDKIRSSDVHVAQHLR
jgi:tungstate transport system permease protein